METVLGQDVAAGLPVLLSAVGKYASAVFPAYFLPVQVVSVKGDGFDPFQGEPCHEVIQQPVLAHDIAVEDGAGHSGVSRQHFRRHVIVTVDSVQVRGQPAEIAAFIARAVQCEAIMMGRVGPGNAFRIGAADFPHHPALAVRRRGVNWQVVRLRAVEALMLDARFPKSAGRCCPGSRESN